MNRLHVAIAALLLSATAVAETDSFGLGNGQDLAFTAPVGTTILNSAAPVTGINPAGTVVSYNTGALQAGQFTFAANRLVLLVRSTGIAAATSGDQTAIDLSASDVGRFEFARVQTFAAGVLTLTNPLVNAAAFASDTQVVAVPEVTTFTVANTRTVTSPSWNGASGGVVAFLATGTVTLTGSGQITASSMGFRGGTFIDFPAGGVGCVSLDGTPPAVESQNARKGEGLVPSRFGAGNIGRGNITTGGGGGNCHNAGGGGGSHGGRGGIGGNSWVSDGSRVVGGLGGAAITYSILDHLFFGGGGGAGSGNNNAGSSGGRGGGIVVLRANALAGAGFIRANGAASANTPGNDAAGGAGAGGVVSARFVANAACGGVEALGGNGGNATSASHGPGGGGGGGRILFQAATTTGGCALSVLSGVAGTEGGGSNYGAGPTSGGDVNTIGNTSTVPGGLVVPTAALLLPANGTDVSANPPTFSGTATPGSTVSVRINGAVVCTATATVLGTFSCTPAATLAQGLTTATAVAVLQGLGSTPSSTSFTIDTVAPLAPVVSAPADGSSTNDTTPTYSGTAEPGTSVTVRVDGVAVCTVTAVGGNFSCTPVTALIGPNHTVNATTTDAAGNVSPPSATNAFTVDTAAPAAPVVNAPADGSSTNDTTPTYSGTAEAGSSVTVRVDGVVVCTVTAAAGAWSCTPVTALVGPSHTVNATATDAASNTSPTSATNTFTIDTAAPTAPIVTAPVDGSTINDATPTYSGTAEAGSTVTVRVDGVVVCTVTAVGGAWSCTPVTALVGPNHSVNATATDAASNTSPTSATSSFTVDTVAPAAPVVSTPANGATVNDTTPTYSGTAEPGTSVTVRVDGVAVCTVIAVGGNFSCTPATPLVGPSHTVDAIATDAASNTSPPSTLNNFTVDTTAPPAPVMSLPANGSFTNNASPTYIGTAEPGSTVTVSVDGAVACVTIASATGSFSCLQPTPLTGGPHSVNAIARDAANNPSPVSNTNNFTVDTTPPAAPVVVSPANGGTTNSATPTYSGTAEPNSTVAVIVDGMLACITMASATGAWSCVQPTALSEGSHTVEASARDAANNASPNSAVNTFTVDTSAPAAPVVSAPSDGSASSNNFPTYGGAAEAGTTVTVRVDGTIVCTAVTTAGGAFSCAQPTALLEGVHTVNATATDAANNTSPVSNTNSFTVDATAPAAPVVTAPVNNGATGNLPTYSGTAEPGSTVTVSVDGTVACTATATAAGTWSCAQPTALANGPHTVDATAKDPANNTSGPSATISFGVDTAPPDTSIVSGPPAMDFSSTATFDFSSTEAGSTFECSLDGAAFTACTDPVAFMNLAVGMHTLQVRATDPVGNVDPTPAQQTWQVLPQLDTTIVSGPPALTKVAAAAFDFASNTAGVTYECSVDGAAFAACADPASITGLPDGPHSLRVRAMDTAGNIDTTPALHLWTLDTLAPGAPIITSPTNASTVGITPPTITGTGEPGATVTVIIDGVPAGTAVVGPTGTWTFTPAMPLPNGMHTVSVSATDPAGNTGPSSPPTAFTIDPGVLDTAIVSGPSGITNVKNAVFDFSSNKMGVSYECSLDAAAFIACTDPVTFSNLGDGPHTLLVRARDGMGNTDASPASRVWTIDSVAPAAAVVTAPANNATVGTATPTVTGTAEPGSTVTVVIDGLVAGTALVDAAGNWSFVPAAPLGAGPHTVAARATDPAGNVGPDSPVNNFTIDTTLLDTFIVSGPMAVSRFTSAAFDVASNRPNVTYECSLDGSAFMACPDPATFTGLADGSHTVRIRARDAMGNVDATPATFTWKVDTTGPAATVVTTPANGATLIDSRPTVTGTAEPGASVLVSIDGQPVGSAIADAAGNWSLPLSAALADGSHTVNAVATDAAGNKGPASTTNTFTVVTSVLAPPTITQPANATLTNDATPTVSGKAPPNSTVSVFVDGVLAGTTTADANGDWSFTVGMQPDGPHTITARADKGPQRSALSAPTMITIDATPPDVQILVAPPATNLEATASFEFGSNDPAATYECSVDAGTFGPCPKDHRLTGLALGEHTLTVRAIDAAGNRSTPKSVTWTQAESIQPPKPLQQLVGGGCGCSTTDPTALFTLLGLLGLAVRRSGLR